MRTPNTFMQTWPCVDPAAAREDVLIYRVVPSFLWFIWFGSTPAPLPPSPVSKLDRWHIYRKTEKERHFADRRGGRGRGGARAIPNHATGRKLVLYKSSNTLCPPPPSSLKLCSFHLSLKLPFILSFANIILSDSPFNIVQLNFLPSLTQLVPHFWCFHKLKNLTKVCRSLTSLEVFITVTNCEMKNWKV